METKPTGEHDINEGAQAFARGLIEAAATQRFPELFASEHPGAIYWVTNRHGVSVVALPTSALPEGQLVGLLKYRMAQYLSVNFVDAEKVYEKRLEHEPLSNVELEDVHIVAGSAATGEILCYAVLRSLEALPGQTMRDPYRPLFPVEKLYGWGIFNRLRILPDLRVAKVREVGRFVKNQRLSPLDELGTRGPVEVGVALIYTLTRPLRMDVDAVIGDIEESVAGQNLTFFHVPMVVIHSVPPYSSERSYLFLRYQYRTIYPFAVLVSDLSEVLRGRLVAVEQALDLPSKQGLLALLALNRQVGDLSSSLSPDERYRPLIEAALPQQGVTMRTRRELIEVGDRLQRFALFSRLSVAEATTLASMLEQLEVEAGASFGGEQHADPSLYLIESGEAEVWVTDPEGQRIQVALLGAYDYFGEIGLFTEVAVTVEVRARTTMFLLRLTKETYAHYLGHMVEIEQQLAHTAATRAVASLQRLKENVMKLDGDSPNPLA
jgi:hypothetical protein